MFIADRMKSSTNAIVGILFHSRPTHLDASSALPCPPSKHAESPLPLRAAAPFHRLDHALVCASLLAPSSRAQPARVLSSPSRLASLRAQHLLQQMLQHQLARRAGWRYMSR